MLVLLESLVGRGQQVAVDQLLPPLNDALHCMQGEHPQGVQDINAFFYQLVGVVFSQELVQLFDLRDTAFSGNNCPDRVLDRRLLLL